MEVQVVSNEMIKPSSPTPDHLRHYNLSFLDQISPRAYSPFLYYYDLNHTNGDSNRNCNIAEISKNLKESLSQTLALYYPLAGRFIDVEKWLECNDEGVLYKEARVINTRLGEVLSGPVPIELNKLLPFEMGKIAEIPAGVQFNVFGCGGIAIGICITHRLGDALSCLRFIRDWMAIARGEKPDALARPEFDSAVLFPPKDNIDGYDPTVGLTKNMFTTNVSKRFVFHAPRIEALRPKYEERTSREENHDELPKNRLSRIEAVSAFIWTRLVVSTKLVEAELREKPYAILQAVNIRPKIDPPLSQRCFGNYYILSSITGYVESSSEENFSRGVARKIREGIRRADKGFVEYVRVSRDEYFENLKREAAENLRGETVGFVFSSLCRFPIYEADFGLGKPAWVSSAAWGSVNAVGFMDNKAGDGIEAYIRLKPQDMERLEADKEFLAFISP